MRFVPIKSPDQQAVLLIHRVRKGLVNKQNRVANQLRGLLAEFGVVLPKGLASLKRHWPAMRQSESDRVPGVAREELDALYLRLRDLQQSIVTYDRKIQDHLRRDPRAKRLTEVNGIGTITASALVATMLSR